MSSLKDFHLLLNEMMSFLNSGLFKLGLKLFVLYNSLSNKCRRYSTRLTQHIHFTNTFTDRDLFNPFLKKITT